MGKHAYLIMAHNQIEVLKTLLKLIDDVRNDIFLHIDKKARFKYSDVADVICKSKLYTLPSMDIKWGGRSLIECELSLLKFASIVGKYDYYHLLSGVDLPVKTQDKIHDFFDTNDGKQFLSFDDSNLNANWHRVKYHWYLQDKKGYREKNIFNVLDKLIIIAQTVLHCDFRDKTVVYKLGSNWCSLTDEFVRYLISQTDEIYKLFKYAAAADEMFVQTILYNSSYYRNKIYYDDGAATNLRYTDFGNGLSSPRVINENDIQMLLQSKFLFARKFDYTAHPKAVEMLKEALL